MESTTESVEKENKVELGITANDGALVDDDGKPKRTGLILSLISFSKFSAFSYI